MLTREKSVMLLKTIAKGTWNHLPEILEAVPATAIAGKILIEVRKISEEVRSTIRTEDELLNQLIEKYGGVAAFTEKLRQELKQERDPRNPKYINCAIFLVHSENGLSESEQEKLIDTLTGEHVVENKEINAFVKVFQEDYFGYDILACDNPIEVGDKYIAFNFDDSTEHEYLEEDLETIMSMLNKIVRRDVFGEYEGFGTDDSVNY